MQANLKGYSPAGIRAASKAGLSSMRAGRLKMGLSNRRSLPVDAPTQYHSEMSLNQIAETFAFDKKAYMKAYNAKKNGGGQPRAAASAARSAVARGKKEEAASAAKKAKGIDDQVSRMRAANNPQGRGPRPAYQKGPGYDPRGPGADFRNRGAMDVVGRPSKSAIAAHVNAGRGSVTGGAKGRGRAPKSETNLLSASKPRLVTRKGGLNPRARGPRAAKPKSMGKYGGFGVKNIDFQTGFDH